MEATTDLQAVSGGKACEPADLHLPPPTPPRPRRVDEVPLHSEPVEDVLGVPPRWLVRWGNTLISLTLLGFLVMGWIVRYPDVIQGSVVVTTASPPSGVVARASGELIDVRVRGGERVRQGDLLAVIRNAADPAAVFELQTALARLGDSLDNGSFQHEFPESLALGELQPDYSAFLHAYRALRFDRQQDPLAQEIRHLEPQLLSQQQRLGSLRRQRDNFAQQLDLAERDLARSRELGALRMVTIRDVEAKEKDMLTARRAISGADVDLASARIDASRIEQNLANLRMRARTQREELQSALAQAGKNLRSRLKVWERNYALRAPVDGQVSLFKVWGEHQSVKEGENVLAIVGDGPQHIVGRVSMPIGNSGKVKVGQPVHIRLDNYPWQEFGQLRGVVESISLLPEEARYLVEVGLLEGLRTSYQRKLEWRQDMQGQANIVVDDTRLIERVFYQFRKLLVSTASAAGG